MPIRVGTRQSSPWQPALLPVALVCLHLLSGCDSGPPPPLPPEAHIPAPADRSRFEPETLAAFDEAQGIVRQLPDANNWAELGRIYDAHQQLEDAIACYQAAIEAGDESNRTAHLLALALDEIGDRQAAVASMERASAMAPAYGPTFWRLAQWQLEAGNQVDAQQSMQVAMQMDAQDPATLQAYGKFLIDTGKPNEALKPLVLLLTAQPNNTYANYLLGTALIQTGREADGRARLELGRGSEPIWLDRHANELSLLSTGPRAEFLRLQAMCDGGNPQGALPKLQQLQDRLGDDPVYHVQVAKAYRMLKRLEEADRSLKTALELSPEHFSANYQLAGLLRDHWHAQADKQDTSSLDAALVQVDLVLALNSSSAASYAVRGQILDDLNRPDDSAQSFLQADALDNKHEGFGHLAATVYMKRKQWDKAAAILAAQYERYPHDWPLRRELGLVQWKAGQVAAAQETLLYVQQKFPNDEVVARALRDLQQR
ncbi:MAG: tetratricopeptide repeat protein [Planctomycetota bacterium]|nr:tetratricopeptide repeat protein [Planctomycetota bacterium]